MKSTSLLKASVASALMLAGTAYAADITLFSEPGFHGDRMTVRDVNTNLADSGFNDRAESMIVHSGRWEVCNDADFSGYCTIVGPGRYSRLNNPIFRQVSSLREIAPAPVVSAEPEYYRPAYPRYVERHDVDRGRYSALEVYTLPGFRGSTMKFDRSATTLDTRSSDEGIGSLVVREGVWEVCTGLDFSGRCRIYEPGSYARLGSFDGAPIGSLRRIG